MRAFVVCFNKIELIGSSLVTNNSNTTRTTHTQKATQLIMIRLHMRHSEIFFSYMHTVHYILYFCPYIFVHSSKWEIESICYWLCENNSFLHSLTGPWFQKSIIFVENNLANWTDASDLIRPDFSPFCFSPKRCIIVTIIVVPKRSIWSMRTGSENKRL